MNLYDFLEEEKKGVIFCKIGKSSEKMWGKGGHFPFREYIGKNIDLEEGNITFERMKDVVKFLHYGDDLVIFSFAESKNKLPVDGYDDDGGNKGCYKTQHIYVKDVMSFKDARTVDYIYENMMDRTNFFDIQSLATGHLRDRELYEAADRWDELVAKANKKSFIKKVLCWLRKERG